MELVFEVYLLSDKFIKDYPLSDYPELMYKQGRPYNCLLIDSHDGYFICIPFRSNINHPNAYMFKRTKRSKFTKSGLYYSKVLIISETAYFDSKKAVVDDDEYTETVQNIDKIASEILIYVDKYIAHISGEKVLNNREFERKYKFSTLKYFHRELGIKEL